MNSYSYLPSNNDSILDSYKQWLVDDLYHGHLNADINDPAFLQKLSIIQAESVRHDIALHSKNMQCSIDNTQRVLGQRMLTAASLITSSIDDGFSLMNGHMIEVNERLHDIHHGIESMDGSLQKGNQILSNIDNSITKTNYGIAQLASRLSKINSDMVDGLSSIYYGITALSSNISQSNSSILQEIQYSHNVLNQILDELKIPESQRERRYHIEEGIKYYNKGISTGDCLYFEDALDEFNTAISIERKDYFSWYYIGKIYLYSKNNLDFEKALSAFDRYLHYAGALQDRHELYDEAILMKAECKYLMNDYEDAYILVKPIMQNGVKASLRAIKYLSASLESAVRMSAVDIMERLFQKNPYIIMQVLEDFDIVNNEFIIHFLESKNKAIFERVSSLASSIQEKMEHIRKEDYINQGISQCFRSIIDKLSSKETGIVDLLIIQDELESFEKILPICSITDRVYSWITSIYELALSLKIETSNFQRYYSIASENFEKIKKEFVERSAPEAEVNMAMSEFMSEYRINVANFFNINRSEANLFPVQFKNGKWNYWNKTKAELLCPKNWKCARIFNYGRACVQNESLRWGAINDIGEIVIPCVFLSMEDFDSVSDESGSAIVSDDKSQYGVIDIYGKLLIPCEWRKICRTGVSFRVQSFTSNDWRVWKDGKISDYSFSDNNDYVFLVLGDNGLFGCSYYFNRIITPCQWRRIEIVWTKQSYYGEIIIEAPTKYTIIDNDIKLYLVVYDNNGNMGILNKFNSFIVPLSKSKVRINQTQEFLTDYEDDYRTKDYCEIIVEKMDRVEGKLIEIYDMDGHYKESRKLKDKHWYFFKKGV